MKQTSFEPRKSAQ